MNMRILLIEDSEADYLLINRHVGRSDLQAELHWAKNAAQLAAALERGGFDIVLTDYNVPGVNFNDTLQRLRQELPDVPIILVSGSIGEETAVELIKRGLNDFILKDRLARLIPAITRSSQEYAEKKRRREAERNLARNEQLMRAVLDGTTDAIFVKDLQGRYILMNKAAAALIETDMVQTIGCDDTVLFDSASAARIMEEDRQIIVEKAVRTHEQWLTTRNGNRAYYFETKGPIFDQNGTINGIFGIARDITERKKIENAQQFTLDLLRLVHHHTEVEDLLPEAVKAIKDFTGCEAVGIRVLDDEGNIPYQAHQGFGRSFFESESPLSIKSDKCMCINVIKGETQADLPFYTPGGSFYMNATTQFLATVSEEEKGETRNVCNRVGYESVALVPFKSEGRILGLIHVADRREQMMPLPTVELLEKAVMQLGSAFQRARAQAKLRDSESRLRAILDNAQSAIWVKDPDGRFLIVNSYYLNIIGKTEQEVLGRTNLDVLPAGLAEERTHNDRRVIETGRPLEVEETAVVDGEPHTLLSVKFPLFHQTGKLQAISAISTDITRLKTVEASLRQEEEKYRNLFQEYQVIMDNVPDGIVHLSPDLQVRWINKAARNIFNLEDGQEICGRVCHKAFWNSQAPCSACPVRQCVVSGRSEVGEINLTDKKRTIEVRAVPLRSTSGQVTGIIEIIRDITEHRKLEEQFRQAQKMESIGTLAGGIAHDFNNILTAILGYGRIVLEDMEQDSPLVDDMNAILEAGERASRLTKDLLLFSRKQVSDKHPSDLNAIILRVLKFIRRVIGEDVQCEANLSDGTVPVLADEHQIEQVLMNFATNARDAMPEGGLFTIGTTCIHLDDDFIEAHGFGQPGPYALITVTDTGKGMDKGTAEKIFEPFFTTKETGKGTGLGMAVVYGIVKEHQGHIDVYSELDRGTVFKIYLPIVGDKAVQPRLPEGTEKPVGGNETILLAEDESAVRRLFSTLLRRNGYTVIEAANGEEAVRIFSKNKEIIDLALFDLIMPKMDGKTALETIRKIKTEVKGIFVSGYTPENIRRNDIFDLQAELLFKPVAPRDLLKTIRKVLDGR